ncbi:hypothetical protein TYRP_019395 [Tyrophagus putrescentiae]|nr:hypothetical protein TYRP_019395 [Tyrophagus putrescentiae]
MPCLLTSSCPCLSTSACRALASTAPRAVPPESRMPCSPERLVPCPLDVAMHGPYDVFVARATLMTSSCPYLSTSSCVPPHVIVCPCLHAVLRGVLLVRPLLLPGVLLWCRAYSTCRVLRLFRAPRLRRAAPHLRLAGPKYVLFTFFASHCACALRPRLSIDPPPVPPLPCSPLLVATFVPFWPAPYSVPPRARVILFPVASALVSVQCPSFCGAHLFVAPLPCQTFHHVDALSLRPSPK